MLRKSALRFLPFLIVILIVFLLSACSSVSRKFTPTLSEDVSAFSDQTISILSEADLGFGRDDTIYLRQFVDNNAPEEKAFYEAEQKAFEMLRDMVLYSMEITRIAETYDSDEEKVKAYADLLVGIRDKRKTNGTLTDESFAELIQEIRDKSEFRDALLKAQMIISLFTQYMNQVLDDFADKTQIYADSLDGRIDARYNLVIQYQKDLEKEKYAVLLGMGQLYLLHKGEMEAHSRLVESKVVLDPDILPKKDPTRKQILVISEHLKERLKSMHLIGLEIKPDWDDYRATHRELDQKHAIIKDRITKVRAISLLWSRAHMKMASGKTEPAEWFDVQDVQGLVKLAL